MGSEFWRCTIDEIEAAHRGRVDEWKIQRIFAFQIMSASTKMKSGAKPEDLAELPYESETQVEANVDWIVEYYNNAIKEFPNA